jgi:hypothetical protein
MAQTPERVARFSPGGGWSKGGCPSAGNRGHEKNLFRLWPLPDADGHPLRSGWRNTRRRRIRTTRGGHPVCSTHRPHPRPRALSKSYAARSIRL